MTKAEKCKQAAGTVLAVKQIVTPLIVIEMVDQIIHGKKIMDSTGNGHGMITLKARELATAIKHGATVAHDYWREIIEQRYGVTIRAWNPNPTTYRASGRNLILNILQKVSQSLTQQGFEVDFSWEIVNEYNQYQNEKHPDTDWHADYESKRIITIYKSSSEEYPILGSIFANRSFTSKPDKKAWLQVRPAMNIRWGIPSEEEIKARAGEIFYELTASEEKKALDKASNLDFNDRMLRIGTA